jgi:hypothetical protein
MIFVILVDEILPLTRRGFEIVFFYIFVPGNDTKMKTRAYTTQFLTFTVSPAVTEVIIDRCFAGFLKL